MKLTPKQEAFCQAIVAGKNQSAAYRTAYDANNMAYKTVNKRASEMMARGEVTGRVAELRAPVVEAVQYDLKTALLEADEARLIAKVDRDGSVMVQATALKAKLSGLLIEKPTMVQSVLETTSTEILLAMLAEYERRHAARALKPGHDDETREEGCWGSHGSAFLKHDPPPLK